MTTKNIDEEVVKASFPVLNMSCASCAASAESTVKAAEGVVDASGNYANATLSVAYLPGKTNAEKLQKAVQAVGYDLLIESEDTQKETLEAIHEKNYRSLKQKTTWAVILSIPLVIIGMFYMDMPYANEIMLVLATPIVLWFGRGFFVNAWKQTQHRKANMDTLVALSTGIAYLFSLFNMIYPEFWHQRGLHAH